MEPQRTLSSLLLQISGKQYRFLQQQSTRIEMESRQTSRHTFFHSHFQRIELLKTEMTVPFLSWKHRSWRGYLKAVHLAILPKAHAQTFTHEQTFEIDVYVEFFSRGYLDP
jgi:hypothetical protein